jgi:hypothetical protein
MRIVSSSCFYPLPVGCTEPSGARVEAHDGGEALATSGAGLLGAAVGGFSGGATLLGSSQFTLYPADPPKRTRLSSDSKSVSPLWKSAGKLEYPAMKRTGNFAGSLVETP